MEIKRNKKKGEKKVKKRTRFEAHGYGRRW